MTQILKCRLCKELKPNKDFKIFNTNTKKGTCIECYNIIKEVVVKLLRDSKVKYEW